MISAHPKYGYTIPPETPLAMVLVKALVAEHDGEYVPKEINSHFPQMNDFTMKVAIDLLYEAEIIYMPLYRAVTYPFRHRDALHPSQILGLLVRKGSKWDEPYPY